MTIESNLVTVVALDDNVKALLASMKFVSSFPEEAKGIAFYEDGNAQFLDGVPSIFDKSYPSTMTVIRSWGNVALEA